MSRRHRWVERAEPFEFDVPCSGARHRVRWENGRFRSLDHPDPFADRIGAVLIGESLPLCVSPGAIWQYLLSDKASGIARSLMECANRHRTLGQPPPAGHLWDRSPLPPASLDDPKSLFVRSALAAARWTSMARRPTAVDHVRVVRGLVASASGVVTKSGIAGRLTLPEGWPESLPQPELAFIDDTIVFGTEEDETQGTVATALRWDPDPSDRRQPALRATIGKARVWRGASRAALQWNHVHPRAVTAREYLHPDKGSSLECKRRAWAYAPFVAHGTGLGGSDPPRGEQARPTVPR